MSWRLRVAELWYRLRGKEFGPVIVSFASGADGLVRHMVEEVGRSFPGLRHYVVSLEPRVPEHAELILLERGSLWSMYRQLRAAFRRHRIAIAPVLFTGQPHPLRRVAFLAAPLRLLAFNARIESHRLRARDWLASWLFLRGTPAADLRRRPSWWPGVDRPPPAATETCIEHHGRPPHPERRRVAVLAPCLPHPLADPAASRLFHLLRETSAEFDFWVLAFGGPADRDAVAHLLDFAAKVIVVTQRSIDEPDWSTLCPRAVVALRSPAMRARLARLCSDHRIDLVQVESTLLAEYPGDLLVMREIGGDSAPDGPWDRYRAKRFEHRASRRFPAIVVTSHEARDAFGERADRVHVIPDGADLDYHVAAPESLDCRLLFSGSFADPSDIEAYLFFRDAIWPLVLDGAPSARLTVIAGADHEVRWRERIGTVRGPEGAGIEIAGAARDLREHYRACNLVIAPGRSRGAPAAILRAMASQRAVVSTAAACFGLGVVHGDTVWIAGDPRAFADAVLYLLDHPGLRSELARRARLFAEVNYGWKRIARRQAHLWHELLESESLRRHRLRRAVI